MTKPMTLPQRVSLMRKPRLPHLKNVEAVCSITDPFCVHARGAPYPDGQGAGCFPFSIRYHYDVGTFANGGNLIYSNFACGPNGIIGAASYAASLYTLAGVYGPNATSSVWGSVQASRLVSGGLIIRSILPAMTAQGFLIVSRLPTMPAFSATENSGIVIGSEVQTHALCAGMELYVRFKPLGNESRLFSPNGTLNLWDTIKVEIVGAPASASNVIDIEFVFNCEMQLGDQPSGSSSTNWITSIARPNPVSQPGVIQASQRVDSSAPGMFSGMLGEFNGLISKLASNALTDLAADRKSVV